MYFDDMNIEIEQSMGTEAATTPEGTLPNVWRMAIWKIRKAQQQIKSPLLCPRSK